MNSRAVGVGESFSFPSFFSPPCFASHCMLKCHVNIVIITLFLWEKHDRIFHSAFRSARAQVRRNVDGLNHPLPRFSKGLQKLVASVKGHSVVGNHFSELLSSFFFLVTLIQIVKMF